MDQARRLKLSAVAFTIFWVGGMLWWSGEVHPASIVILSVCGALAGYFWFRAMRWWFQRVRLLTHDGIDSGAGH